MQKLTASTIHAHTQFEELLALLGFVITYVSGFLSEFLKAVGKSALVPKLAESLRPPFTHFSFIFEFEVDLPRWSSRLPVGIKDIGSVSPVKGHLEVCGLAARVAIHYRLLRVKQSNTLGI